jgi:RHS repeat-associated protein
LPARRDASGNVYYYFQDQIGTSRLMATSGATVCYDADYTPFGQELAYTTTCSQNYKFTGKERDTETGNDNFGARYYPNNLGRFLTPDPLMASGRASNPQTWNRYADVQVNVCAARAPGRRGRREGASYLGMGPVIAVVDHEQMQGLLIFLDFGEASDSVVKAVVRPVVIHE